MRRSTMKKRQRKLSERGAARTWLVASLLFFCFGSLCFLRVGNWLVRRSGKAVHGDRRAFRCDAGARAGGSGDLPRGIGAGSLAYAAERTQTNDGDARNSVRWRRGV